MDKGPGIQNLDQAQNYIEWEALLVKYRHFEKKYNISNSCKKWNSGELWVWFLESLQEFNYNNKKLKSPLTWPCTSTSSPPLFVLTYKIIHSYKYRYMTY
jgi:hypothetical protein